VIVTATAPGKIVVSGEYAVLVGAPALVQALDRRVVVRFAPGERDWRFTSYGFTGSARHTLHELQGQRALALDDPAFMTQHVLHAITAADARCDWPQAVDVELDSRAGFERGAKLGIGTSAAVCVALTAACCRYLGLEIDVLRVALDAHARAQGGRGSGLDVAAAHRGGLIRYARGTPLPSIETLAWPTNVHRLAIWTRESAVTVGYIERFDRWRRAERRRSLEALVDAASTAAHALSDAASFVRELRGFAVRLAELDRESGLGVFSPAHLRLADMAGSAVVYKPCGAGGGDLGLACSDDLAALAAFGAAAADNGFSPLQLEREQHGVDVSVSR
jgi:phosphomevalonate kinase